MTDDPAREFWTWAVQRYSRPAVSARCLELQDQHGQNVPLLLWALWLGSRGQEPEPAIVSRAVVLARAWHVEVLQPLRSLRRRLKQPVDSMDDEQRHAVRERIKADELDAESRLMATLAVMPAVAGAPDTAVQMLRNLERIAAAWSADVPMAVLTELSVQVRQTHR